MLKDYVEVERYFDNAKQTLAVTRIIDKGLRYEDSKYVKTACGIAYNGVLLALDSYFKKKNIPTLKKGRKSVEYYRENLSKLNKPALKAFNEVYNLLHLDGYYDGITNVYSVKGGFKSAKELVNMLK